MPKSLKGTYTAKPVSARGVRIDTETGCCFVVYGPQRPTLMPRPLDIFKLEDDGSIVWKGTAETLEIAKLSVRKLAETSPGDYLIFSPTTGEKTVVPLKECA
jgi:hypothetical protein